MDIQSVLIASAIGYFIGCIQPSYFIGKMRGVDIREQGSGNAGAANTTLSFGWALGLSTGVFDVLKATLCVVLTAHLYDSPGFSVLPFLSGTMAVMGHNYPFYMGFDGGKGTASVIGVVLGFDPMWGFIMVGVIILSTIISNYLVVGVMNIYLVLMCLSLFKYTDPGVLYISIFLLVLSIYKHRMNFVRIKNKTETTFRSSL